MAIELIKRPYCDDCRDFEPEVERLYADGAVEVQEVFCRYFERCQRIEDHILRHLEDAVRPMAKNDQ